MKKTSNIKQESDIDVIAKDIQTGIENAREAIKKYGATIPHTEILLTVQNLNKADVVKVLEI